MAVDFLFQFPELWDREPGGVHFFNAEFVRHFRGNQPGNRGFPRARLTANPVSAPGKATLRERLNAVNDLVLTHDVGPRSRPVLLCERTAE
jgi:hypothetical protein